MGLRSPRQAALPALLALLLLGAGGCAPRGLGQSGPPPVTYVAVGASDAVGVGAADPRRDGWVPRFARALPPGSRVVNLGVSGSTVAQALDEQVGPAVDAQPQVITVWLAVNDLARGVPLATYSSELDRLLKALAQTHAQLLVGNVPDLTELDRFHRQDPARVRGEIQAWNAAIARVAHPYAAQVVNLYTRGGGSGDLTGLISADGFHPSAAGYALIARAFEEAYRAGI